MSGSHRGTGGALCWRWTKSVCLPTEPNKEIASPGPVHVFQSESSHHVYQHPGDRIGNRAPKETASNCSSEEQFDESQRNFL